MTWLITVARNHSIDRLRARRAAQTSSMDEVAEFVAEGDTPEEAAVASSVRRQIGDCLRALSPDRAEAVRRCYLGGATYQDLATLYDVPLNTIRTWLRRSLLKLRECLGT